MRWTVLILTMAAAIAGCGDPEIVFTGSTGSTTTTSGDAGSGGTTGGMAGSGGAGMGGTSASGGSSTTGGASGASGGTGGVAGTGGTTGGMGGATTGSAGMAGSGGSVPTCGALDADDDGDGVTEIAGDCDDCDPMVNPGAAEIGADALDNDCDGFIDGADPDLMPCDGGLLLDDADPFDAAKTIDLCRTASASPVRWGVKEAAYTRADGTIDVPPKAVQHGLKSAFGANVMPQVGARMLVLSTGRARDVNDPTPCNATTCYNKSGGVAPAGFPQSVPGCQVAPNIHDDVALNLKIRAPTNASGFSFAHRFYSFEYPQWVCTSYNDQFVALLSPMVAGAIDNNIVFDDATAPIGVNCQFMSACDPASAAGWAQECKSFGVPCPSLPNPYCPLGVADIAGTGFAEWAPGQSGATAWLTSTSPIQGGADIEIRFAIWDSGDQSLDSTVLIDAFQWTYGSAPSVSTLAL